MALSFAHGTLRWLSSHTAGTDIVVSSLGFQPKAIMLWCTGIDSATDAVSTAVSQNMSVGFIAADTDRRGVAVFNADNVGTSDCAACFVTSAVIPLINGAGTIGGLLDIQTIDSDGFTMNVDAQGGVSLSIHWAAWGGTDITNVTTGLISEPAATGTQNYTATGFTSTDDDSQAVILCGIQSTAAVATGAQTDAGLMIGFATGTASGENVVVVTNSDDASNTTDSDGFCQTGKCLANIVVAGGNVDAHAALSAFGTDVFTLNWGARALTSRRYLYMAIKGGNWKAGGTTINGSSASATVAVSGLSFTPNGLLVIGRNSVEQSGTTSDVEGRFSIGVGSSSSSRRALGTWDENTPTTMDIDHIIEYDQVLAFPTNAGAAGHLLDIDSMQADGFTLINDAVSDGVASEWIGYLTFGNPSNSVNAPRVDHSYTAQVPQAKSQVAVATRSHTYTAQEPQAKSQVAVATRAHTYTAQEPKFVHTIPVPNRAHTYTAGAPEITVASGNTVSAPTRAHTYTGQVPKVNLQVAVATRAHTYTAQEPQAKSQVAVATRAHTYTAQTNRFIHSVQTPNRAHTYAAQTPKANSRVQPAPGAHTYSALAPTTGAGATVSAPTRAHTYTGHVPTLKHTMAVDTRAHTYTTQLPTFKHTLAAPTRPHTYTAQAPQAQARIAPPTRGHTYTGAVPSVFQDFILFAPRADHTYTGREPGLISGSGIVATLATHNYVPRVPQVRATLKPASATCTHHARAPYFVGPVAYTSQPLRNRVGEDASATENRIGEDASATSKRIGGPAQ